VERWRCEGAGSCLVGGREGGTRNHGSTDVGGREKQQQHRGSRAEKNGDHKVAEYPSLMQLVHNPLPKDSTLTVESRKHKKTPARMMACRQTLPNHPSPLSAVHLENRMEVGVKVVCNLFRLVQGWPDDKVISDRFWRRCRAGLTNDNAFCLTIKFVEGTR